MASYKNFTVNTATTPPPWGPTEEQMIQDIINTLVVGTVTALKATGGHHHYSLYDTNNVLALSIDGTGLVSLKNGTGINEFSIDGTMAGNSDTAVPTEKAIVTYVASQITASDEWTRNVGGWIYPTTIGDNVGIGTATPLAKLDVEGTLRVGIGTTIGEFSVDGTLAGNSDAVLVSEKAIVTYVASQITAADEWTRNVGGWIYPSTITDDVGIGTTTPLDNVGTAAGDFASATTSGLHIKGDTDVGDSAYLILEGQGDAGNGDSEGTNATKFIFCGSNGAVDQKMIQLRSGGGNLKIEALNDDKTLKKSMMSIFDSGHVGIGASTTSYPLEIYSSTEHPILSLTAEHATDYDPQIQFRTDSSPTAKFTLGVDGADDKFKIYSGEGVGGTTEFVIDTGGNVGIGTATPLAPLHVETTSYFKGNVGIGTVAASTPIELYSSSAHPIQKITAAHATDYDPQIKFATDVSPTVKFSLGVDGADDKFKINNGDGIGGTSNFVIDTAGLVGIGTNSMSNDLHLFRTSGYTTLEIDNRDAGVGGAASMYLQNDAIKQPTLILYGSGILGTEMGLTKANLFEIYSQTPILLGTLTTDKIHFGVNSNVIATVSESGVGIGTTNPLLNVGTAAGDFGSATANGLHVKGDTDVGDKAYLIVEGMGAAGNGEGQGGSGSNIVLCSSNGVADEKMFQIRSGGSITTFESLNDDMTVQKTLITLAHTTGNVGIGTVSANNQLDVGGDMKIYGGKLIMPSTTLSAAGPTDNVDVSGSNVLFIDTTSNSVTIGAFVGGVAGQVLHIVRTSSTNDLTIEHDEGTANQNIFLLAEGNHTITTYGGFTLVCNGASWFEVQN